MGKYYLRYAYYELGKGQLDRSGAWSDASNITA
jgi:hypothetical protein